VVVGHVHGHGCRGVLDHEADDCESLFERHEAAS
jgi:hypothetical protein